MKTIKIKNRYTGAVIYSTRAETVRDCVAKAIQNKAPLSEADLKEVDLSFADLRGADLRGADLRGADLWGADLRGADLRGADLRGADLRGADLRGADLGTEKEPLAVLAVRQIGPIGSRGDVCFAFRTKKGLYFRAGCFFGPLEEFRAKVQATHGQGSEHGMDYADWMDLCERWNVRCEMKEGK